MSSFRVGQVQGCITFFLGAVFGREHCPCLRPFNEKYGFFSSRAIATSPATPLALCVRWPQITMTRSHLRIRDRTSSYDAQPVWIVFNIISAVGIVIALAVNLAHVRSQLGPGQASVPRLGAYALFYATAALAIWFFRNWVHLLALEEGESVGVHSDVIWMVIGVLILLVLATTGWRLWRQSG